MPASVNNSCVVCSNLKSSYKCPKCRSCYCSLQCNRVHKSVCTAGSETIQIEISESNEKVPTTLTQPSGTTLSSTVPIESDTEVTNTINKSSSSTAKTISALMSSNSETAAATARSVEQPKIEVISSIRDNKITEIVDKDENVKMKKIVEMFSSYDDSDAESDEKESQTVTNSATQADKQPENSEEILIDDIPQPDIKHNIESASSSSSTRRVNHNIDSNDMCILSSETVQTLLKSDWARNVLKSSRLRDDILSVDSSQNRQGASLCRYYSICLKLSLLFLFLSLLVWLGLYSRYWQEKYCYIYSFNVFSSHTDEME